MQRRQYRPARPTPGGCLKVKELIAELSKLDQNLDVFCYESGPVPIEGRNPGPFDIVDVTAESTILSLRSKSGARTLQLDNEAPRAVRRAIIGISPDF
jgi:hypothetical protein